MAGNVILAGEDYEFLMELAVGLRGTPYTVTVAESTPPLAQALRFVAHLPKAMLVVLDGLETVVDVRALLSSSPEIRFVFVVPEMPPRASLARVIRQFGGVILSRREAPIVIVGTLVALLAETPAAGRPSGAA